ncbi:MAG: RES family NAD+ phosphorylase [Acetobacteraceae bacterium]|jgi:RES domain
MGVTIDKRHVVWQPCWRIVPSRFPPIDLFERIADPADWEVLIALESLTNDRIRDEVGNIALVPAAERVSGPGSSVIMAAFTHPNPDGSRFSDGSYGVFYAGETLGTAISETRYHRARFMQATGQPRMELDMRVYAVELDGELHDISGKQPALALVYHPDNYAAGQALAVRLRAKGSSGIVYDSVRHIGGICAAVFRPRCLSNPRQERHLCYVWDGLAITTVYEKRVM